MQRLSLAVVVLMAGLTSNAYAQDVSLDWKFTKDATFFQKMETTTNQKMTIGGQSVTQTQNQEFVFQWTVKNVDGDKVELEQKIVSINMTIKVGPNTISYSSTAPATGDNPLAGFFKPLIGATFTIHLLKTDKGVWKVDKVAGREEFVKKLTDANATMAQVLKTILSEEQLKQMAEPAFAVLPGKPVKKDDEWARELKLNMGAIGSYDATYKYKYVGAEERDVDKVKKKLEKITMVPTLVYKAPAPEAAGGLPFKIESGSLETKDTSGTIWFDPEAGRVQETDMKVKLKGTLKIVVSDTSSTVDIEQEMSTKTTTHDKNPNEKTPG